MAECDFILPEEEQRELVRYILAQGAKFVPCLRYRTKVHEQLSEMAPILRIINTDRLIGPFLLMHERFSREPPALSPSAWGGRQWYTVDNRYGGPYLDLFPCFFHRTARPPLVTAGFLGYYPTYYLNSGEREVPAPDELKSMYRSIKGFIQRRCVKFAVDEVNRLYWVAPRIMEECRQGLTTNVPGLEEHARAGI